MSGPAKPEDHFLARWARRKREASDAELAPPPPLRGRDGAGVGPSAAEEGFPGERASEAAPTDSAPDPSPQGGGEQAEAEPLPSIDDLTAESDVAAFLRPGVPQDLTRAALRRAWSLDPAIRDFVGPAEYAWDFNDPGAMAGFSGSTGGVDLATLFSGRKRTEPASPEPPGAGPPAPAAAPAAQDAAPVPAAAEPEGGVAPALPAQEERAPAEDPPSAARGPRHGGAAPR